MVRYGLIWGRIAPGDDHEMGHFLEKDMPGLIVVCAALPPLKYLITLGLMKLGAPAIVPGTFPFPYGYRLVAEDVEGILERIGHLPNLRQRYYQDEIIRLPAPCNPALIHEEFEVSRRFGGDASSFFCVRPAAMAGERLRVVGEPAGPLGILVSISAEKFSDDVALSVERAALRALNMLPGVHAYEKEGVFFLDLGAGVAPDATQLAGVIHAGIRLEYPRLRDIAVEVLFETQALVARAAEVRAYKAGRQAAVAAMTEHNTEEFCACTECRPFSLVHTCILVPGRMPMCGTRTYASVKAAAYFGSDQVPWKRPSEQDLPMRYVFPKGKLLDPERGEYEGCNQVYRELTHGRLQRVYLHSVRDYPRTSCGCFQALAFWLPEVAGLGIMARHAPAVTPDGHTWEMLANRAGGKQSPGIVGVSHQYMHSPDFLKGDGGMANVVWVDSGLYARIAKLFLPGRAHCHQATGQHHGRPADISRQVKRVLAGRRIEGWHLLRTPAQLAHQASDRPACFGIAKVGRGLAGLRLHDGRQIRLWVVARCAVRRAARPRPAAGSAAARGTRLAPPGPSTFRSRARSYPGRSTARNGRARKRAHRFARQAAQFQALLIVQHDPDLNRPSRFVHADSIPAPANKSSIL